MPGKVDEELWAKAKAIAAEAGHAEDWAYVEGIYKSLSRRMTRGLSREYLEAVYAAARRHMPQRAWSQVHQQAVPSAGGRASWRRPALTPWERIGLEALTEDALAGFEDDDLLAAWGELEVWSSRAGRRGEDADAFRAGAAVLAQALESRGLVPASGHRLLTRSADVTLGDALPRSVPVARGLVGLVREDGATLLSVGRVAGDWATLGVAVEAAAWRALRLAGATTDEAGNDAAPEMGVGAPLYDLALVRSRQPRPARQTLTRAEVHEGAMVAIMAPAGMAERLQAAGLPVDLDDPGGLHMTLAFLGPAASLTDDQIEAIQAALAGVASGAPPFDLRLSGLGRFTSGPKGSPVYLVGSGPGLTRLQATIEQALADVVDLPGGLGWVPHMTLAYIDPDDVVEVGDLSEMDLPAWRVDSIHLRLADESGGDFALAGETPSGALRSFARAAEQRVIYYVNMEPDVIDSAGNHIDAETIEASAWNFLADGHEIHYEHGPDVSNQAETVESYLLPATITPGGAFRGEVVPDGIVEGSHIVAIRYAPELWAELKDLDHGISFGATAKTEMREIA